MLDRQEYRRLIAGCQFLIAPNRGRDTVAKKLNEHKKRACGGAHMENPIWVQEQFRHQRRSIHGAKADR